MKKRSEGFTLIEMLITIVVIALVVMLLSSYLISKYKESKINSDAAKIISDITQIIGAQEVYYAKKSSYGTKEDLLSTGILKSWPIPSMNTLDSECVANNGGESKYELKSLSIDGKDKNNLYVVLPCLSQDVAEVVNVLTSGGTPNLK